jgi:hypothetical protein
MATVSDHPSTLHRHSHSSEKPKNKFTAKSHSQLQTRLKTHSNFPNTRTNSRTAQNQTKIKQKSPNRLHRCGVAPFQGFQHSPKQPTNEGERPDPIDKSHRGHCEAQCDPTARKGHTVRERGFNKTNVANQGG